MKVIKLKNWNDFSEEIEKIRSNYESVRILYRGQENSEWSLSTTLERKTSDRFDALKYIHLASKGVHQIQSFTDAEWDVPDFLTLQKELGSDQDPCQVKLLAYNYLVYLRHHGFPSPLLDWTESPYIAAYFALINSTDESSPAVYCYIEMPNNIKSSSSDTPMITVKGPYVTTHKRHFSQKAWYTIATEWDINKRIHYFCLHEKAFEKSYPDQDLLIKIILPKGIKKHGLTALDDYNINHFTLFQSEDALIKTIETKVFDIGM